MNLFWLMSFMYLAGTTVCNVGESRADLINKLFLDYVKDVRPLCELNVPIDVKVGIAVRQIIELEEPKQILTFNGWIRLNWNDCRLQWNSSDFSNISKITIPISNIWEPDVTLYDYTDNENEKMPGIDTYLATIQKNGDIFYMFPTVIKVFCKIDVTYYPFDKQICPLMFSSWAYDGLDLNVINRSTEGDISNFQPHVEWDLIGIPMETSTEYYTCCDAPYPKVTFKLTLRRKALFYVTSLLFPCVLITAVSLFGFMLPPDSGEKVSLQVTVFLSLTVFLLVVLEHLPASSESFPYIGWYFAVTKLLVSLSTIFTVFILNIHYKKGQQRKKVPKWLNRVAFRFIGPLLMVNSEHIDGCSKHRDSLDSIHDVQRQQSLNSIVVNDKYVDGVLRSANLINNARDGSDAHDPIDHPPKMQRLWSLNDLSSKLFNKLSYSPIKDILTKQLRIMKKNEERIEQQNQLECLQDEWRQIGIIADRFFLILCTITLFVTSVAIMLQLIT